ncbi:MAG: hypothetical protein KGN36_07735 [Acidobacteriota bacterium]|nr:hypothetical protein [Acidobacteriota bacterium]
MSCPYFYPTESRGGSATLPLGDFWTGECRAGERAVPTGDATLCNLGYARGECPRFPAGEGPDAVRFAVAQDRGAAVELLYAIERGHYPDGQGTIAVSADGGASGAPDEVLGRQAAAYAASYRRRKEAA